MSDQPHEQPCNCGRPECEAIVFGDPEPTRHDSPARSPEHRPLPAVASSIEAEVLAERERSAGLFDLREWKARKLQALEDTFVAACEAAKTFVAEARTQHEAGARRVREEYDRKLAALAAPTATECDRSFRHALAESHRDDGPAITVREHAESYVVREDDGDDVPPYLGSGI